MQARTPFTCDYAVPQAWRVWFPPLQCTLAHYNSNSLLHPHSEALKHSSAMSDFFFLLLFAPNFYPFSLTWFTSLYVLNPSLTIQLSCLWTASSGWVVYICMRTNVNCPFLLDFGKSIMHTPQAAARKTRSPLSRVMLANISSPKKLQNYHHHNQPVGQVTRLMKNKGLLGAIGGIIQMLHFYLFWARTFKVHDTYFFDIKGIESIFYPGHSW